MPKLPWMLLCNPHSPEIVWPGHFVTDRGNPQNFFKSQKQPEADIEVLPVNGFRHIGGVQKDKKLSLALSSFTSQFFSKGRATVESLEACQATRYLLVQADMWFDRLCADREVQDYLEKKINRDKKKVWLITGILTLADAKVSLFKSTSIGVGAGGSVPLLAAVGVPVPLNGLDPGAEVSVSREAENDRSFKVPNEKVFEIQFSQVKLARKRASINEGSFRLESKPKWAPQWDTRSSVSTPGVYADEDDWESEEEEFLEAGLENDALEEADDEDLYWAPEMP